MSYLTNQIINDLKRDCILIPCGSRYSEIKKLYINSLEEGKRKGFTPIILHDDYVYFDDESDEHSFFNDNFSCKRERSEITNIIKESQSVNVKEILKRSCYEETKYDEEYQEIFQKLLSCKSVNKKVKPNNEFTSLYLENNILKKAVILIKVPTNKPWELAAWFPIGGYNNCPMPYVQVAIFKNWFDKYKAFPALITGDTWEFYVEKPPKTYKEAISLAKEHFMFCFDRIFQCSTGGIEDLAGELIKSKMWYFWWD